MIFLIKRIVGTCLLLLVFYSLVPSDSEIVNARENFKYNIEDINCTAGVEEVFNIEVFIKEYSFDLTGYTTAKLNIRDKPSLDSNIIETLPFNTEIQYDNYNEDWAIISYNNVNCYISKKYISDNPAVYTSYKMPKNSGFKSYMSYKSITNKNSKQYKLQKRAYTGKYGIRMVDDRYCVVLGSYFDKEVGSYFDLILKNGTVIKCILGDVKSSVHTYEDNITSFNGCVSEFIVDSEHLKKTVKLSGDISNCNSKWNSPVKKIYFY